MNRIALFLLITLFAVSATLADAAPKKVTPESLRTTESQIQKLSADVLPAVVSLIPGGRVPRMGTGSAVIVSKEGLILTAAHVAVEMGEKVAVIFNDGSRASAEVLGMDLSRDAAMLQITGEGDREFPFVEIGDSTKLTKNEWCIGLGHAGGYQTGRTAPIRLGRVISNDDDKFLRSDCAIISGDSGGPLFDLEGKLIGIHSNIGFSLAENRHVPISVFSREWDRMLKGQRFGGKHVGGFLENPYRPMMGAVLGDPRRGKGALIIDVVPDSPAQKAGLKSGDRIMKIAGKKIADKDVFLDDIGNRVAGETIAMTVKNGKEERSVSLTLAQAKKLGEFGQSIPRRPGTPRLRPQKKQAEPEPDITPEEKAERDELQAKFNKRAQESLDKGKLQFELAEIEKFREGSQLGRLMKNLGDTLSEEEMVKLLRMFMEVPMPKPGTFDPDAKLSLTDDGFFREVLDAYNPSVSTASDAVHPVFRGNEWKALCTVIHKDGYAITKASEIETKNNQKLNVLIAKKTYIPAKVVKVFAELDIALLELDTDKKLPVIQWDSVRKDLPLGSFIAAAGPGPDALAIGVISVKARTMSAHKKGFLGIGTEAHDKGVKVTVVMPRGSAEKSDVRKNDVITKVDGAVCDTPEKLIRAISGTVPGSVVKIEYLRGKKSASKEIKLGDRGAIESGNMPDRNGRMNRFGTGLSKRVTGYGTVIQTDLPIEPEYCGGPVVDLDGKLVGFNIARAGRIKTYALPAADVKKEIEKALPAIIKVRPKPAKKEKPAAPEKEEKPEVKEGTKPVRA